MRVTRAHGAPSPPEQYCVKTGRGADLRESPYFCKGLDNAPVASYINSVTYKEVHNMNKAELIEAVAKDAEISRSKAADAVDAFIDSVSKSLKKGQKVTLVGFGTFGTSKRKAREGRNPQTEIGRAHV